MQQSKNRSGLSSKRQNERSTQENSNSKKNDATNGEFYSLIFTMKSLQKSKMIKPENKILTA